MGRLLLVRHGQANYDIGGGAVGGLTDLGHEQAMRLGGAWAAAELQVDRIYVGTLRRQEQTLEAVVAAFRARGVLLPEATVEPALDEYPAVEIFKRAMASGLEVTSFPEAFEGTMRRYVEGELVFDDLEGFDRFRRRVEQFLEGLRRSGRGETVAAFTSGGPVAAAVGHTLRSPDEKVLELSWTVRNAAVTEVLYRQDRLSLIAFNQHPHLDHERLLTYR